VDQLPAIIEQERVTIAVDVMGGDHAPNSCLEGVAIFMRKNQEVFFKLFGPEPKIMELLERYQIKRDRVEIIHTDEFVSSDDQPSAIIRSGRNTSMRLAINAVKDGVADAVVSSGNTGALMAMSKIVLKTIAGIDRPAICTIMPSINGSFAMLDLGANPSCDADNLVQFAIMGDAFARTMLGSPNPSVGILNIGSEIVKGNDTVKAASKILQDSKIVNFYGYIEGDDLVKDVVDVVVTDGFTGNVALKTAEGTARLCREYMSRGFKENLLSKLGYLLAKGGLKKAFDKIDHRYYNGAIFLGLNGIAVKSHGSADAVAFANAIKFAETLVKGKLNQHIIEHICRNL